ncbi:MAG: hypothetical protein QOH40_2198 [Arthrobacter pascens]|nr:hypothetical protein [Arthrobacter pascens]
MRPNQPNSEPDPVHGPGISPHDAHQGKDYCGDVSSLESLIDTTYQRVDGNGQKPDYPG